MNKQEAIEEIKAWGSWCTDNNDGTVDIYVKVSKARDIIKQLDEPKKMVHDLKILLNELNKLEVADYSTAGAEVEYVLTDDTAENRKQIDIALATQFSITIVNMQDSYSLTPFGFEIIRKHTEEGFIDLVGIIWECLENVNVDAVYWSVAKGFEWIEGGE